MLDALGEEARSREGVSLRPSSEGVIGRVVVGIGIKPGIGVALGVGDCTCALDCPSEVAGFSPAGGGAGGSRSFSISDRRLSYTCG